MRGKTLINKIRNKKGDIKTDTTEIKSSLEFIINNVCGNKFDNLKEMDKFLDTLNDEDRENLNRPTTNNKINNFF
jgi:hypothetical protein